MDPIRMPRPEESVEERQQSSSTEAAQKIEYLS